MSPERTPEQLLVSQQEDLAAAYSVLSRVLLGPADTDLLTELAQPGLLEQWPLDRDVATCRGLELLATSLNTSEGLATLERDYQRLFVGPGPMLAPPYESVHLTSDGLLFEAPTFAVRAAYEAYGLAAPRPGQEPDDHLGLELAFLARLCALTLDAVELGDTAAADQLLAAQQIFLTEHVLRWGDGCLEAVEQHAQTAFYRGFAALGLGLLAQVRERFG
jgi:TorA maturation chaperone TorD